jgi:hypothetical protein
LVKSLQNVLDCFLSILTTNRTNGEQKAFDFNELDSLWEVQESQIIKYATSLQEEQKPRLLETLFLFSLVWSIGAVINNKGRILFDSFLRDRIQSKL